MAADGKGFPDLVLVRDRLIAAEIKGDGDTLRAEQKRWHSALLLAGVETYVWTPRSWLDGEIEKILTRRVTTDQQRQRDAYEKMMGALHGSS